MIFCRASVLIAASLFCPEASSFLSANQRTQFIFLQRERVTEKNGDNGLMTLHAKTKKKPKKKGKATVSATGGFGKVTQSTISKKRKTEDDDYAAFPALQDQVKETLIPSDPSYSEISQELPTEIYERLNQIYGFENFNYPVNWFDVAVDEDNKKDDKIAEDEGTISFDELLSSDSSKTTSSTGTSTDFGDLIKTSSSSSATTGSSDFSDLIASATGGELDESSQNIEMGTTNISKSLSAVDVSKLKPFSQFRVLHVDPMVLAVDDFMTSEECDEYVNLCKNPKKRTSNNDMPMMSRSKTVGKDSLAKAQRTSTTWFHHFKSVPALMAKATRLMGLDSIDRWEEPQAVRYQQSEKFTWHLDAIAPNEHLDDTGGQRVATLLVYLTDIGEGKGGATAFRDLGGESKYLKVQPKKGSALLFFPAAGGIDGSPFDIRTLHAGEALSEEAIEDKWIAQMWLRENSKYKATAPPGNSHAAATDAINEFCSSA